jgi:hypothetical protein
MRSLFKTNLLTRLELTNIKLAGDAFETFLKFLKLSSLSRLSL